MGAALVFVTKGIDTALRAKVRIGAGLVIVVVVTRCAGLIITRWAWCHVAGRTHCSVARRSAHVVARCAVVKLTRWALALRAVTRTGRTITKRRRCAFSVAGGAHVLAVTADVSIGARSACAITS